MRAVRVLLVVVGMATAGYGGLLLWDNPPVVLIRIVMWAAVGLVVHDLVFAPLCVAVGLMGRRLIPVRWWSPVAVAGLCSVVLAVLAVPVYGRPGMRPDNPTVLNRDYPLGLWISLAVVWSCVPIYMLLARRSPVGQHQVVYREGTDNVERQPPSQ